MKIFNVKPSSKDLASQRLKLILIHDRNYLDYEILEAIKSEIITVIHKYVDIDDSEVHMEIIRDDTMEESLSMLVANIQVKNYAKSKLGHPSIANTP